MMKTEQIGDNRRIMKNTIMLYIRMLLVIIIGLFTGREVLRILGVVDYGIYNVVGGIVALLAFMYGSLGASTARFLTYELGRGQKQLLRDTFTAAVTIHFALALVMVILFETVGLWFVLNKLTIPADRMYAAIVVYHISVLTCFVQITMIPFNSLVIAHERMDIFAFIGLFEAVFKLLIVYLLIILPQDKLIMYAVLYMVVSFISTGFTCGYCLIHYPESRLQFRYIKDITRKMLSFASWDLYGNLSVSVRGQGINILQNMYFGPVVNAATAVSNQIMNGIMGFANNFLTAVNPQVVKLYAANELEKFEGLVCNASKYCTLLLFIISFPVLLDAQFILNIWLVDVPDYAAVFCQLTIVNNWISIMFRPVIYGVYATGNVKRVSFINGSIYLLVLPLSYVFLKNGGTPIVPFVLNIILLCIGHCFTLQTIHIYISQFSIRHFIFKAILPTIGIMSASAIVPTIIFLTCDYGWARFITTTALSILITAAITFKFGLSRSMQDKVYCTIRNKCTALSIALRKSNC